jgi:hypothetical protein
MCSMKNDKLALGPNRRPWPGQIIGLPLKADLWTSVVVGRYGPMLSKSLCNKRNFLKLLMGFVRGDVRDHTCLRKTTTDLRIGTTEHRSGGVV